MNINKIPVRNNPELFMMGDESGNITSPYLHREENGMPINTGMTIEEYEQQANNSSQEIDFTEEKEAAGAGEPMEGSEVPVGEEGTLDTTDTEEKTERPDLLDENAHEHLTQSQLKQLDDLLHTLADGVKIMNQDWLAVAKDYGLTDKQMTELGIFNSEHCDPKPENLSEEEDRNWDYMNGLNKLTEEDVEKIFPDKTQGIYGFTFDITKDRIHEACSEFFQLTSMKKEYGVVLEQYSRLLEENEQATIAMQRVLAETEQDPELRAKKIAEIDKYYYWKYLKWLREPVNESQAKAIINALSDANKVLYYHNRCKSKLETLQISPMIVLELNKFENKQLEEKYWPNQGVLVLYFMTFVAFANLRKQDDVTKIKCMVIALDRFIRKSVMTDQEREEITTSVIGLEDQFIGKCPVPKTTTEEHTITPPTTDIPEVVGD